MVKVVGAACLRVGSPQAVLPGFISGRPFAVPGAGEAPGRLRRPAKRGDGSLTDPPD